MEKQLAREVAKARTGRQRIEDLIRQARAAKPPVSYARLEEITGWTREFLRRIANGESPQQPRKLKTPSAGAEP